MDEVNSDSKGRTKTFSRNQNLEALLGDINSSLWMSEKELIRDPVKQEHPLILVMGPLRSGTTLFMQWLANTGLVCYPTNLLSRFYNAPIIGAKIQLLLTDPRYNFRDELGEFVQQTVYKSENGKTKGVLAPNEFWYFWRRFLAQPSRDIWTDDELKKTMDVQMLKAELAGIMDVFQKPFAAKGMLFNYNIPFLDSIFDKVIFIQIKRDLTANVASVLEARKRQMGSENEWYSFSIPEYEMVKDLDPISQAASQVNFINNAVSHGFEQVSEERKLVVEYEKFCTNPRFVFDQLVSKLGLEGDGGPVYFGSSQFEISRKNESSADVSIREAIRKVDMKQQPNT